MNSRAIAAAAALTLTLSVAGCSGGGDDSEQAVETSPTTEATSEAPTATLREVCPQVEDELTKLPDMTRSAKEIQGFGMALQDLQSSADPEASNALQIVIDGSLAYDEADPFGSHGAWLDSISAFAKRCKIAGSSALQ